MLARVAAAHMRTATAANNALILAATGLRAWTATVDQLRPELRSRERAMTDAKMTTAEMLLEAQCSSGPPSTPSVVTLL